MFTTVVDRRKRRLWATRPVVVSLGAHLLVLAGIVATSADVDPPPVPPVVDDTFWVALENTDRPAPTTTRTTTQPPVQAQRGFVSLPSPETVPDTLPPVDSTATPLTKEDVTGLGREIVGVRPQRDTTPRPPAPDPPLRDFRLDGLEEHDLEQLPQLADPRDALRILERMYPPMLRDAGVTGRTTVVLTVDRTGSVVPGSVTVRETTHEGFRDAAVRAAERFRFRPATLNGQPYAAVVSLPIEWKILR